MPKHEKNDKLYICSFCGKNSHQVDAIITGPGVFICNECVQSADDILKNDMKRRSVASAQNMPTPTEVKEELDNFVLDKNSRFSSQEEIESKAAMQVLSDKIK